MMVYVCLLLASVGWAESARILAFFPIPIPSHHFAYRPILEELGKRGHEILYVTAFAYDQPPEGIEQMDITEYFIEEGENQKDIHAYRRYNIPSIMKLMYDSGVKFGHMFLGSPKVQKLIHSDQKFDAVIFESYFFQEYLSAFIHKFDAIGIDIMPLGDGAWLNELSGLPNIPAYQIDWKTELSDKMSFWQRMYSTYVVTITTLCGYHYLYTAMEPIMNQYFNYTGWETRPSIDVLAKNRSLILINAHHALTYPFPTASHVKRIGGINIVPNKPLPQDIQEFMDESNHGVIYMSLGSYLNFSDPANTKVFRSFVRAFEMFPQHVLIYYEANYRGVLPRNLKLGSWMPQQDVLAHKNAVLFITNGGLLDVTEALYHGVPILGVPFFGHQQKNLIFAEYSGYGRFLKYENLTKDTIQSNIREILSDKRYVEEATRRSEVLRDERYTPAEEAVYWIEHSLKYPFALTPKSIDLSPIQLHMIDINIFVILSFVIIMYIIFRIIYFIVKAIIKLIW